MAYLTQQDLVDRFGSAELIQLTDRTNRPATTVDVSVVARAIADASELADSYLTKLYQLPLAPVPAVLTRNCCDIARYFLWGKAAEVGGPIERAYGQAVSWLKDVSKGLVELQVAGQSAAESGGAQVKFTAPTGPLSRDAMGGF